MKLTGSKTIFSIGYGVFFILFILSHINGVNGESSEVMESEDNESESNPEMTDVTSSDTGKAKETEPPKICYNENQAVLSNSRVYDTRTEFFSILVFTNAILYLLLEVALVSYNIHRYMVHDKFQIGMNIALLILSFILCNRQILTSYFYDYMAYNLPVIYYLVFYIAHPYAILSYSGYCFKLIIVKYTTYYQKLVNNPKFSRFSRTHLRLISNDLASILIFAMGAFIGYVTVYFSHPFIYNNYLLVVGIATFYLITTVV